jgi:cytidyltransferase-like protein
MHGGRSKPPVTRVYLDMVADAFDTRHLELLRDARALGDELVVGLHADDDCEWFHRRPGLSLDERTRAVATCSYVDGVVAGAPVFITRDWLRAHGIDIVAHSSGLPERALQFWYRVPIEMRIFRIIPVTWDFSSTDLEGRLRIREMSAPAPASLRSITRDFIRRRLPRVDRAMKRRVLVSGLQRLADALHGTPLDGHYWIVGGLLLGWAREGRPLASDLQDADFAYLDEDHERFLASVSAIVGAGLMPKHRFSSADGRYVMHRFLHRGAKFEFFRLTPSLDRWRYSMPVQGDEPTELVAEVPAQSHVSFRFVGRTWRKVVDHELALRCIYGDWRTDRPEWSFTSDRAIVDRIPIAMLPYDWAWPNVIERGPGDRLSVPTSEQNISSVDPRLSRRRTITLD